MKIYDIEVHGIDRALRGLARSYGSPLEKMHHRAIALAPLDKGHNKFLRQIQVWCEVEAPRFWWAEFDTYKVGTTAQSDSTMHTLSKGYLSQENFELTIMDCTLENLNDLIAVKANIEHLKNELPEGFIQGRTLNLNYAVLREITLQRYNHKLPQWQFFLKELLTSIPNIELLGLPEKVLDHLEIKLFPTCEK